MSKEIRGTKRLCQSCGAKFYDLGRSPVVCPACGAEFVLEEPKAKPEPEVAKPEATEPADASGAEVISLDEAAAEEEAVEDADLADIDTDEENISSDGEEDVFLEDDEDESGSDVSGIIGGPIDTKEES